MKTARRMWAFHGANLRYFSDQCSEHIDSVNAVLILSEQYSGEAAAMG
jgi:hypothetical protein